MNIFSFAQELEKDYSEDALPPVDKWNPEFCGELDIFIDSQGLWHYLKTPIGRAKIVRLFSTLLKLENEQYYLVTPVEKIAIKVADVPFIITDWQYDDKAKIYSLFTLTGDKIVLDANTKLEFGKSKLDEFASLPYVCVRKNLYARLNRSVYYQLLDRAEEKPTKNGLAFIIKSGAVDMLLGFIE